MTRSATEELLLGKRPGQNSPENDGGATVVEFAPAKAITLLRTTRVLPGQDSVAPAEALQPVETTTTEVPSSSRSIRWWDLLLIALSAYLAWAIFCFVFALVGGILYFAMGHGTDPQAFATAASRNFYFTQISTAIFYLAFVLAMRRVLRKRRGRGSFTDYFRPIGGRPLLYAALSGLVWSGVVVLLLSILWSTMHWQYHPAAAGAMAHSHSIGRLAMLGLMAVVLAPLAEEMFFRGLLLEWFQQRLAPLPSALITAAIFALWHLRFLQHPGIVGWIATAAIAGQGFLCALWAQRTLSLRAPAAAHATYNATLILVFWTLT
jgi:membrane protease YdiL (CAAX protease family)